MTENINRFENVNRNVNPSQEKTSQKAESFFNDSPEIHQKANKENYSTAQSENMTETLISAALNKKACELVNHIVKTFPKE